jgi:hypothetical protein
MMGGVTRDLLARMNWPHSDVVLTAQLIAGNGLVGRRKSMQWCSWMYIFNVLLAYP